MTNQTNPAQSMPITMEDSKQVDTRPPSDLPALISSALALHIDMLVETKFNAMVENRRALALLDQEMYAMIDEKIETAVELAMNDHESNSVHNDSDDVERIAADAARDTLREYARTQTGWITEDEVKDLITTHVDEEIDGIDWEERVKDVLREML